MSLLAVTMKGQVTLKRDLLQHLGGELRVRAARPVGTIDSLIGRHAGKVQKPLTIEEMNAITAAGWAGEK